MGHTAQTALETQAASALYKHVKSVIQNINLMKDTKQNVKN